MKLVHKLAVTFALTLGPALGASAAQITFDDLTGGSLGAGELVTNQYAASLGVTFSDSFAGGAHAENFLGTLIPGATLPNVLWADQGGGSPLGEYLQIDFASPVVGVSALFGTSLNADITMQAFSGVTQINAVTLVGTPNAGVLFGTISLPDAGITSVRLFSTSSGGSSFNFSIDNLTFAASDVPVPAPQTALLMLAALGAMGVSRRARGTRRA